MDELLREFHAEATETLAAVERVLARLAAEPGDAASRDTALRLLHSLKGASPCVGLHRVEAIAHAAESLLQRLDARSVAQAGPQHALQAALARMQALIGHCHPGAGEPDGDDSDVLAALDACTAADPVAGWTTPVRPPVSARLAEAAGPDTAGLPPARLKPIGTAWQALPALVDALAARAGKVIALACEGAEIEVDSANLARLREALIPILRNACVHGIEPPQQRIACGKPPRGSVRLSALRDGPMIVVEIADDGRGLDWTALRRRVAAAGLIAPESDGVPDHVMLEAVFAPGVTTAEAATPLAGRGLGLAIARAAIEAIGGTIAVRSCPGAGTAFTIRMPRLAGEVGTPPRAEPPEAA